MSKIQLSLHIDTLIALINYAKSINQILYYNMSFQSTENELDTYYSLKMTDSI